MPSPAPLLFDTFYHIHNRGNNRENLFVEDRNYLYFLGLLSRYIAPVADIYAYCLLKNHFHLLVRVRSMDEIQEYRRYQADSEEVDRPASLKPVTAYTPSKQFSDLFVTYAKAMNKAYGRTGSLFQHPFGRVMVTSDRQLWRVIAYIHQNPCKHGFEDDFRAWPHSSYAVLLSDEPSCVNRQAVFEWFGGRDAYIDLHAGWVLDAQSRWMAEGDEN